MPVFWLHKMFVQQWLTSEVNIISHSRGIHLLRQHNYLPLFTFSQSARDFRYYSSIETESPCHIQATGWVTQENVTTCRTQWESHAKLQYRCSAALHTPAAVKPRPHTCERPGSRFFKSRRNQNTQRNSVLLEPLSSAWFISTSSPRINLLWSHTTRFQTEFDLVSTPCIVRPERRRVFSLLGFAHCHIRSLC